MALMTAVSKQTSLTQNVAAKIVSANVARAHLILSANTSYYVGGSDVSETNGMYVPAGTSPLPIPTTGCQAEIWAVSVQPATVIGSLELNLL